VLRVEPAPVTRRRFAAGVAGAAGVAVLSRVAGCTEGRSVGARLEPARVTYLTGFGSAGRESFAWVAQAKGFFRDAGLDVAIELGAAGDANHQLLAAGRAQFASVDASGAFTRFGRGADTTFRIVAAVQQQTLLSLVTLEGNRIAAPADLEGRTVGVAAGAASRTVFPAYARLAGVDESRVRFVDATPQALTGLLVAGRVDAIGLFVVGTPAVEKVANGRKAVVLPYSTYLADLFGTVLVTPKSVIDRDPELVRRFCGALLKGLVYALDNPDEAGAIMRRAVPESDAAVTAAEMTLMRPYALPGVGVPVGVLELPRVARTIALLQALGLYSTAFTPEQIVRPDLLGAAPVRS
jgi:NitT/TauT family transport system substrate-binding protein